MNQETVGSALKGQRLKAGLTLEDVSRQTYIRPYYLDAIERGDYETVGDSVYVKGFIRNYAVVLGLDAEELLRRYRRESAAGERAESPRVVTETRTEAEPTNVRTVPRRTGKRPWTAVEWAILAAGATLLVFFWVWFLYL